ncbi:MAG: glycosyltransferase [Acidobacteria bacterium]|nr:glycosyltransferase [Acidobacteriota bacterium]
MPTTSPHVSIVVPAYNAEATLPHVLAPLQSLPPDWEVVVADDHSSDATAEIARQFGARVVTSAGFRCDHAARNTGARAARGDVLVFLDADVVASVPTLVEAVRRHERENAGCVFAVYDRGAHLPDVVSRYKNFWIRHTTLTAPRPLRWVNTSLAVIRRAHLEQIGGLDENFSRRQGGGDLHFGTRIAKQCGAVLADDEIQVTHLKRFGLSGLARNDFLRARGWFRLALAQRGAGGVLRRPRLANVGARFSWACLATAAGTALLALGVFRPPLMVAGAAALAASAACNGDFLVAAARQRVRGWPLFVPLLWFDQLACAAGLAVELGAQLRRRATRRSGPLALPHTDHP